MQTYLEALDLWDAVQEDYEVLVLPDNPTMAQIKNNEDRRTRKAKAKAWSFNYNFHKNYVFDYSKGYLGLPLRRVCWR